MSIYLQRREFIYLQRGEFIAGLGGVADRGAGAATEIAGGRLYRPFKRRRCFGNSCVPKGLERDGLRRGPECFGRVSLAGCNHALPVRWTELPFPHIVGLTR